MEKLGNFEQTKINDEVDIHCENLKVRGFTIINNFLSSEQIEYGRKNLYKIKEQVEEKFDKNKLNEVYEDEFVRLPLKYDKFFLEIFDQNLFKAIINKSIKYSFPVINLQNGIINRPLEKGYKSKYATSWHRDFYYMNIASSSSLAFNCFICLDDFKKENGGTVILPFSHKFEEFPSDEYINENQVFVEAKAGSIVIFDSLLLHRGGDNLTTNDRVGLNTVITNPILRQQFNIPKMVKKTENKYLDTLLGYYSKSYNSIEGFYEDRFRKFAN